MSRLSHSGTRLSRLTAGSGNKRGRKDRSIEHASPEIIAFLQQGCALQEKGEFARAAGIYQAVLARCPDHPDALDLLGSIALSTVETHAAVELFERAIAARPGDAFIRTNLGNALLQGDRYADAEKQLRRALKLKPADPRARCLLAECRMMRGDPDEAKALFDAVLSEHPTFPQALMGLARLCASVGDVDEARSLFRRALALGTVNAAALIGLSGCEKFHPESFEVEELQRCLAQPGKTASDRVALLYTAAKVAGDLGHDDEAFRHYSEAKKLVGHRIEIADHRRVRRALKELFTPEFFASRKHFGDASKSPVFIVGMPRSGTTLTEQIISSHPDVCGAGELTDIPKVARSLGFRPEATGEFPKRLAALGSTEARTLARSYLSVLRGVSNDAKRVTDKMPYNFQHLGLIALLFPNARIIHCRRNPMDTCVSIFTTHLKLSGHTYATDLSTLGAYYREYSDLMAHWREVLPIPILDLDYEALVDSLEEKARELIDFIGLPWDPACLSPRDSARPVNTASRFQVRQPLYKTSVGRWRRYEKHLGPLLEALGDLAASEPPAQSPQ